MWIYCSTARHRFATYKRNAPNARPQNLPYQLILHQTLALIAKTAPTGAPHNQLKNARLCLC